MSLKVLRFPFSPYSSARPFYARNRRGIATDDYILQMQGHAGGSRQLIQDVIGSSQISTDTMITTQPIISGVNVVGLNMDPSGDALHDFKQRYYDEVGHAVYLLHSSISSISYLLALLLTL